MSPVSVVGAYVGMASLGKISSIKQFAFVSLLAAGWGLALTPFFVGFAGSKCNEANPGICFSHMHFLTYIPLQYHISLIRIGVYFHAWTCYI